MYDSIRFYVYECIIVFRYVYMYTFYIGYYFLLLFLCWVGGIGSMEIIGISFIILILCWERVLLGLVLIGSFCVWSGEGYTL